MKNIDEIRNLIEKQSQRVKEDAEYLGQVIHDYYYGGHICDIITVYLDSNNTYHEKPTANSKEILVAIDDYRTPKQILDSLK